MGCIRQIAASMLREMNSACYSAMESPHVEYFPSSVLPRNKKVMIILGEVVESHKGDEGTAAPPLRGKTDRYGTVLPRDQKTQEESYQCI